MAACPWPSSMLQHIPPLAVSLRLLSLFPNGKRKRVPFIFMVLSLAFLFYRETNKREQRQERKDEDKYHLLLAMGDGTGVPLDRFLHLQARKKDAPETKNNNVSLCLYPCRYLSFFRSFFSFRSFPVPTSISHSLILSLSVSQSLYLTLCAMEAGACCTLPEKRHPCDLSSLTSFSLLSIYYLLTD